MAFQMIPPRVSSSPPPLDSLPTVTCPGEEDDDEFGDFSTHNSSFDITGLSDKLPPTPDASPSKFPGLGGGSSGKALSVVVEGMREDTISQDSGVGSANHPNEFSPLQPDGRIFEDFSGGNVDVSRTTETKSNTADNESSDDFADFQSFAGSEKNLQRQSSKNEFLDNGLSSSSSQADPRSFTMGGTPPPLDHVADTTALDDEFTRYSPNLATCSNEFGNFTSFGISDTDNIEGSQQRSNEDKVEHIENKETSVAYQSPTTEETKVEGYQAPKIKSANVTDIVRKGETVSEDSDSQTPDDWYSVNSGDSSNDNYSVDKGNADVKPSATIDNELTGNSSSSDGKDSSSIEGAIDVEVNCSRTTKHDDDDGETNRISNCADTNIHDIIIDSSASLAVQEEKDNFRCSTTRSNNQLDDKANIHVEKEPANIDSTQMEEDSDFGEFSGSGFVESASNFGLDERTGVIEEKAQSNINFSEEAGTEDEDFGGFVFHTKDNKKDIDFSDCNKSKPEDVDDDDDDLDFADIRAKVESGMFEAEESPGDCRDFGTFASAADPKDDEDFGDFGAPNDEFGDFGTAANEDDFGDFSASAATGEFEENLEFEGQFGDFSATGSAEDFGAERTEQIEGGLDDFSAWKNSNFRPVGESSPVLRKLESLVLKWIPKQNNARGSSFSGDGRPVPSLHQVVESDAFVWHHLENLEGSAALKLSWGNTQAHNLFLSSVNVDARNIVSKEAMITLFGQKWSSSVPLFAQTLSFSPLTPAKSSEGSGGSGIPAVLSASGRGPTTPPISAVTPTGLSRSNSEETSQNETTISTDGNPEEQIPPAKFDWTSSGLTNPLEGPAYNSSLFDLDLLLTNSSIGKGATNALLASLEREFLSEGGEKGSSGRLKGPPAPSPLVQQILGGGMNTTSATTPLQSLAPEVRHVVERLPDLGFMRSRVLMFPIRGEQ